MPVEKFIRYLKAFESLLRRFSDNEKPYTDRLEVYPILESF